ncbi:hypothetical protein [Schlesneria sp. DSM 10557]|uniref:hypothetical protein n=1 Tax=Schlesneria sp. DSM 10557 TaxID=3044399 RepID=UPI00359FEDE5
MDLPTETPIQLPKYLHLELHVREPEVIAELCRFTDDDRDNFALSALRIGVLALRQASGVLDASTIRLEGDRLVGQIRELMTNNTTAFLADMSSTFKAYFDPSDGHFPQRVERLIKKDGELQSLLANHLEGEDSIISRTLGKHIGLDSPLLRMLSPEEGNGLISSLNKAICETLLSQRTTILNQFSLDDKESAMSRLVNEMTGANGRLRRDLAEDVQKLHSEFSLDNEEGALSRLVGRVENAQRIISNQFSLDNKDSALSRLSGLIEKANLAINDNLSLDNEQSPLFRLRRELTEIITGMQKTSGEFHEEVKITLESFKVRRAEAARSTRHGGEFEEAVGEVLQNEAQRSGDVLESTGNRTGVIAYCKMGDHVVTLGAESAAPGARIVVESKEDKSYDLKMALKEIEQARHNRECAAGVFVFSKVTAPAGLEPFARHGNNLVLVWDREDPATDIYLKVGLSVAKALVIRDRLTKSADESNLAELTAAVLAISTDIAALDEITVWANTVKRTGTKIGAKAGSLRKKVDKNLLILKKYLDGGADSAQIETTN